MSLEAASDSGTSATLELVGCGTMQRIRKKQLWSISIRNVGSDPGAVTIVGIEEGGECIDCVKVKNFS